MSDYKRRNFTSTAFTYSFPNTSPKIMKPDSDVTMQMKYILEWQTAKCSPETFKHIKKLILCS